MSAPAPPHAFRWDGDAMVPLRPRLADRDFVIGQVYTLAEHHDRSMTSHSHQFAWLAEAWRQLPEDLVDIYPDPEMLRKRALVQAGYYTEMVIDAGSHAAALRVASTIQARERFAVVIVRGSVVLIRDPKSQSLRSMGAKEFQESKTKVLEIVSGLIGITPEQLQRESGKAA